MMYLKFLSYCACLWWHLKLWTCCLSLSDYNTLSHSWSGFSTSDTVVKNKIPFIYISSVTCIPTFSCAHVKHQPTHCGDKQRFYDGCSGGGVLLPASWQQSYLLFCFSFMILQQINQYVSALCFILFLGRNHYWCLIPLVPALPTVGQYVARVISTVLNAFTHFTSYFSLLWNFSCHISFKVVFVLYSSIMILNKRCCQAKILRGWVVTGGLQKVSYNLFGVLEIVRQPQWTFYICSAPVSLFIPVCLYRWW